MGKALLSTGHDEVERSQDADPSSADEKDFGAPGARELGNTVRHGGGVGVSCGRVERCFLVCGYVCMSGDISILVMYTSLGACSGVQK